MAVLALKPLDAGTVASAKQLIAQLNTAVAKVAVIDALIQRLEEHTPNEVSMSVREPIKTPQDVPVSDEIVDEMLASLAKQREDLLSFIRLFNKDA